MLISNRRSLLSVAGFVCFACASAHAQLPSDISSILQGLTGGTTTAPTTTTPTTTTGGTTTAPTDAPTDGTAPITNGLNNVGLGSLQNRSPGAYVQRGIQMHLGNVDIPGDADQFEKPSFLKNTVFDITESALQVYLQGIPQLFTAFLSGLGIGGTSFGPGQITVGPPLANQTTLDSGMTIPLP